MTRDLMSDSLGDGVGGLGDSLGDSLEPLLDVTPDIDEQALADLMPIADSPAEAEAELEDMDFEGFIEIDPDNPASSSDEDVDDIAAALEEYGYDTADIGKKDSFNAKWVGEETEVSSRKAAAAGHEARNDMAAAGDMGVPENRHDT